MLSFLVMLLTFTLALAAPAAASPQEEEITVAGITYRTIDTTFDDVAFPVVTGAIPGLLTGVYTDRFQKLHSFFSRGAGRSIALPRMVAQDVNAKEQIVGWYRADAVTPQNGIFTWGFLWQRGHFETLTGPSLGQGQPRPTLVEPLSINDAGFVCGSWRDPVTGRFRGFRYNPTPRTYTMIDVEGALSTTCLHVAQDGRLLVRSIAPGGVKEHWLWDAGTFTPLTVPDLPPDVDLVAHQAGITAGNVGVGAFVWDGATLHEVDVPGSTLTEIHGLQVVNASRVRVVGRFIGGDDVHHGFVARVDLRAPSRAKARTAGLAATTLSAKMRAPFTQADCSPVSKRAVCQEREE